jgi:hypothetical protein
MIQAVDAHAAGEPGLVMVAVSSSRPAQVGDGAQKSGRLAPERLEVEWHGAA